MSGNSVGEAELWNIGMYFTKRCAPAPPGDGLFTQGDCTASDHPLRFCASRPTHKTDALGGIPEESLDNLAAPPGWNAEGKLRLAKTIVARDLGIDVDVVSRRLDALAVLIPDLGARFDTIRPGDLARLAVISDVTAVLLRLRTIFPTANVSAMVARRPELLLMDSDEIATRAEALRALMPGVDADAAAAEEPRLLNTDTTRKALAELRRLMPGTDPVRALAADTSLLSSVDTGEDLIPYDNGTLAQLKASLTGAAGAAPDGW